MSKVVGTQVDQSGPLDRRCPEALTPQIELNRSAAGCVEHQIVGGTSIGDDGAREMFVGDVVDASARSNFDPKLIALGRALAKGVLTPDEIAFQQEVNFVRTLARLEAPHIRVLQVIGEGLPQQRGIVNRALIHGWEVSDIVQAPPEFGEFAAQLVAVLASEDLIHDEAIGPVQGSHNLITGNGRDLLNRVLSASEPTLPVGA